MVHKKKEIWLGMIFLLLILLAIILALLFSKPGSNNSKTESYDAHKAVLELDNMIKRGDEPPEVENIDILLDNVIMIAEPRKRFPTTQEGYQTAINENTKNYFPYMYYDLQYPIGDWSPGLETSLTKWSPGFYSGSGWYWWIRPNATYNYWPRSRWVRNNGKYYNMNNYGMFDVDKRSYNLGQARNGFGQPVFPPSMH